MEALVTIGQTFGEESMSCVLVLGLKITNELRLKKARQVKSKVKSILIIFFGMKGIFTRNSSWQAKQLILQTIVTLHGDYVKICEDLIPNFDGKRTGCCIMTTHCHTLPFSTEFFYQN
jgi:hypothetical protein